MSQIVCPHCKSTNSIETAGQRYCADCGQLITGEKDHKKETKKTEKKAEKKSASKTVAQKAPVKTAPPLNLKAIEKARGVKPTAKNPAALDLRNSTSKKAVRKPIGKHIAPKPVTAKSQPQPEPITPNNALVEAQALAPTKRFRHKNALRDAFKSLTNRKTIKIALLSTLITTICEVVFVALFAKSAMYAITESYVAGSINAARAATLLGHLAWAGLLGFIGYLIYHYGLAEIIFRTSRAFDRRSASASVARRAALGSLAGMFVIDVTTWLFAIVTIVFVTGANFGFLGTKSLGLIGVGLAVATNLIAAYVWLGLVAARHMATYAIVLGQVGVYRAYSTGWAIYNRQFGRITTGLILVGLISLLVALPASILHNVMGTTSTISLVVTTALTAITQAVVMIIGAVYFLRLYRFVISQEYDSDLGHLLSGRQPQASHVGRRLVILGVIAAVMIAVTAGLIVYASPVATAFIR